MAISSTYSASATIGLYGSKFDHVSASNLTTVGTIATGSDADGDYIEAASQPGNRLVSGTVAKLSTTSGFTIVAKIKTTATGLVSIGGTINDSLSYLENLVLNQGDQTGAVLNGTVGLYLRGTDGLIRFGRTPAIGINDGDVHTVAVQYGGGGNTISIYVDGFPQTVSYGDNSSPGVSAGNTQYPVFIFARNVRGTADQNLAGKIYAYARLADDGFNLANLSTDPSEIFDLGGDATAPVLTSPTGTQTGQTTATGTVSTDEGNGTLDAVVTTSSTTPSAAQIQAGQDHTGAAAAATDLNNTVSATGSQSVSFTGLTAATTYYVHYVHEDAANNVSTAVTSSGFTTASSSATVTVTDPLKNNTGTLWVSETGIKASVLNATTLESVYEVTGLTTNASGVLEAISNAALNAGDSYHVAIKLSDGSVGITGSITAT